MNAAVAAQAVVKQVEREKHASDGNTAILEVLDDIEKILQQKPRLLWSPSEFDEMFQTVDAVKETIEKLDDAQFGAAHPWFSPLLRHVCKLARCAVHMLLLFEEQQDKWYFRPAALAREARRLDELLQDAMGVVANATQGVPPSPQAALHTPEARTFWKDRIDPHGSVFELEIARFQEAVVEELDPDGGWTEQQKAQYLEVMAGELDKHNVGMVSVYDFSEFTAEKGLRASCMQLFLRLILTFGSRKMEAVRKQAKRRQQQADLRAGHGDTERVIEWMDGEGFPPETAGILLKNDLELGDLWRLRDSDFRQMGIHSMGTRRKLLGAARRLRSLYLKPAPGGFAEWMESQGLEDYIEVFAQHKVDFDVLNEMDHDTLKEMGIHFGDRVRVLRAVESLKAAPTFEEDTNYPLAGLASLFGKMEGQYKAADLGAAAAAKLARQSIAEFVTGEFAVAGVDRDLTLAERKLLVARDSLGFVASVVDGKNRQKIEQALATIARDYEKFQEDLVLDMSTVLDAMRSESTRANRQLMGEACYMLRGMMTGVLLGPDHALNSLTTAERRKVVATHDGLDAVMQCIIDATGDADDTFLLQAFECLCELGGAEACRAQMAEEGTASLVLSLMSGHLANARVAELGCHLCMQLLHQRLDVQESVASLPYDGGLAVVLYAMKAFPADGGVQCCGIGALAAAADNASNATLIVAQGGLPLICSGMRSFPFPGDVLLQWHACQVLCHIANASPADYTQLAVKEGALVLVTGAMRGFPAHPQLQTAALWFLDVCAALQPLHEMLMREHVVALCCSAIRTFPDHAALLLAAFSTLGSLASSRSHHDAIQREGAVAKVASALRTHPRDKKVLAAALGALTQLATIDAEALRAIRREGALEASIAALKFFHVDAPIQRHGLSFIVNTLADSHCRQVAFALGLADISARALRYFPGDRTIEAAHQAMEQTQFGLAPEPQERSAAIDYKSSGAGMAQTPQLTNY